RKWSSEKSTGVSSERVLLFEEVRRKVLLAEKRNNMSKLRPRLCVLEKGPSGYGFHLHGEKGKTGQFIRLVEPDTPADTAGLLAGDRLMFVNGDSVEGESHQQVVARIRVTVGALELIVVDPDTAELLKKHNLQFRKEFVTEGIPVPGGDSDSDQGDAHSNGTPREGTPAPKENGDTASEKSDRLSVSSSTKEERGGPRPRLCHMKKGTSGYGFNLHSEKSRPGQFIRAVDKDSPAETAGLRPQDKIIQVNGVSVIGMQHSEVVAAIKTGGDETTLLVVDAETEEFFKRCNVLPTEEHVTGTSLWCLEIKSKRSEAVFLSLCQRRRTPPSPADHCIGDHRRHHSLIKSPQQRPAHTKRSQPPQHVKTTLTPPITQNSTAPGFTGSHKPLHHNKVVILGGAAPPSLRPLFSSPGLAVVLKRELSQKAAAEMKPKVSVSSSDSSSSSNASLPANSSPPPEVKRAPEPAPADDSLGLGMSLAQAKERARQKRAAKKAPAMDWSKRNELFSNL
ncbi:hypothetical protein L3Q82_010464, partial [Scortum barcoo]